MFWKNRRFWGRLHPEKVLFAVVFLIAGFFTACGQESGDKAVDLSELGTSAFEEDKPAGGEDGSATASLVPEGSGAGAVQGMAGQAEEPTGQGIMGQEGASGTSAEASVSTPEKNAGIVDLEKMFGESCIAEQTFEVELSEYSGKVWFVPYRPSADNPDFRMQIVQDGEVLEEITAYVPKGLAGVKFGSLDAVSFFDINYDDITDIVLIETYGSTTFAAVYYGHNDDYGFGPYFLSQDQLSAELSRQVEPLTVPKIRGFLSDGKKNGEFSGYQEAYRAVGRLYEMEGSNERKYDLIYIDDNEIPELVAGVNGYYVSLYSYSDGKVYRLMDDWGYGAMGNAGYEYSPEQNSLRNYNADYAGAILYTTYMTVTQGNMIDVFVQIKTCNFDDVNGNGVPDEDESGSLGRYSVSYVNGEEVPEGELISYDRGEYEYIEGKMSLNELLDKLNAH